MSRWWEENLPPRPNKKSLHDFHFNFRLKICLHGTFFYVPLESFCFVLFVLFMWWAGNCSITESLPEPYPASKTGPRRGPGRPALMASRLETTRSLECQPLPPPRSQQWLLKGEARS